jgi:hypothetical protein
MRNINIFYLEDGFQFTKEVLEQHRSLGWTGREPLPLHILTQIELEQNFNPFNELFDINIINNGDVSKCKKDEITLVPIDIQSFPITIENRKYYELSHFGIEIDKVVQHILSLNLPNLAFLFYSSTEPYFFDANIYFAELGAKNPHINIILSGSGETEDYFGHFTRHTSRVSNVHKIHKLWYFDRVHYMTFLSENEEFKKVHMEMDRKMSGREKNLYDIVPNKFVCTLRNCRAHRLLFSTMLENSSIGLEDITYGRFYSLRPTDLMKIASNQNTKDEYPYHIELISTSLNQLLHKEELEDSFIKQMMNNLMSRPHIIDMKNIDDRGIPGHWLYEDCDIVISPGGEPYGYGYVDEKQFIPMAFKKPYITFGCKGIYEELKNIDFKTFDDCWPVNFNQADTLYERVKGFFTVFEYIRNLSPIKYKELLEQTKESVEFNYNHLVNGTFRRISNENFFKELNDACS